MFACSPPSSDGTEQEFYKTGHGLGQTRHGLGPQLVAMVQAMAQDIPELENLDGGVDPEQHAGPDCGQGT